MSVRARPPWPGDEIERVAHQKWYSSGREGKAPKLCRLCGRGDLPTRRHSWHPRCAAVIQAAIFPYSGLAWTLRRQRGRCATCPAVLAVWEPPSDWELGRNPDHRGYWNRSAQLPSEVDHRIPLWRIAMMESPRDSALRWWLPGNLQALCRPCHRAKTKREAAERAELRARQLVFFPIAEATA